MDSLRLSMHPSVRPQHFGGGGGGGGGKTHFKIFSRAQMPLNLEFRMWGLKVILDEMLPASL